MKKAGFFADAERICKFRVCVTALTGEETVVLTVRIKDVSLTASAEMPNCVCVVCS